MIQLQAVPAPTELTAEVVAKLTAQFQEDGSSVWQKDYIKKALLEMSNYKCAYSEVKLQEEGKYMEVEHFLPKSIYPDKVVEWNNLLPASKFCNGKKGDRTHKVIHPIKDNPKHHLYMVDNVLYGKTQEGRNSVIILGLNDPDHLLKPRYEIRSATQNELHKQYLQVISFSQNPNGNQELEIIHALENLLKNGNRKEAYSATIATTILNDPHFKEIRRIFTEQNIWNVELQNLEDELSFCSLDMKP
jgi:uncharacterized protein (TIGR02646 family)